MSDLEGLMEAALAARAAGTRPATSDAELVAAVSRGASAQRRRRATVRVASVAGPVIVAVAAATMWTGAADPVPAASASPAPSVSSSPASSPMPTASSTPAASAPEVAPVEPTIWSEVPDADRPPFVDGQAAGLPEAREMEDWIWGLVDGSWGVEVRHGERAHVSDTPPQSLYLVAPDGELLRLFTLRQDFYLDVVASDLEVPAAWIGRYSPGDGHTVVQVDLVSGASEELWGDGAVPAVNVGQGGVWQAAPVGVDTPRGELWATSTYVTAVNGLFLRESGTTFAPLRSQPRIDALVDAGSLDGDADSGVLVWLADDGAFAVHLAQFAIDFPTTTGEGVWVIEDLATGEWREAAAALPNELCRPVDPSPSLARAYQPVVGGSYGDPEPVVMRCGDVMYAVDPDGGEPARVP